MVSRSGSCRSLDHHGRQDQYNGREANDTRRSGWDLIPNPNQKSNKKNSSGGGISSDGIILSAVFVVGGMLHFVYPRAYEQVIPPYLPAPLTLVLLSGAAEIVGGVGAGFGGPRLRRASGWGLILLLIAVFPANIHMALHPEAIPGMNVPRWLLFLRLPLQPLLMLWVWRTLLRRSS